MANSLASSPSNRQAATEALYEFAKDSYAAGKTLDEAKRASESDFGHFGLYGQILELGFISRGIESVYIALDAQRDKEQKRVSKEAQGVALYDALTALGWKPPE